MLDMNKTFFLKTADRDPQWRVIDAEGKVLGRLATRIADALRGKDKALFTPHMDGGDYVVVINIEKVVLTGKKWQDKIYERYSGWIGGRKEVTANEMRNTHPERLIELAVKGMLPKNRLSNKLMTKLKVYKGSAHPHQAQVTVK